MSESYFNDNTVESDQVVYAPSTFAKMNLLYIQETGSLTVKKPHLYKRINLPSYLFFIVVSGSGTVSFCDTEYSLSAGDCFFADCMKSYSHISGSELWTLRWVHFSGTNMRGIYDGFIARCTKPVFRAEEPQKIESIMNKLAAMAVSDNKIRDVYIYSYLTELLAQIISQSWKPVDREIVSATKVNIDEIKDYIDTHYVSRITLDDLASRFYINKYYLTRIFTRKYGITIMTYVLQKRINKAKLMLMYTDFSIDTIVTDTGFSDRFYFSRIFKKLEGITPCQYRKAWME